MNLLNEFQPIKDWAYEKGITTKGDPKTQVIKLMEEVGELSVATLKKDEDGVIDAIGDCVIVLTSIATLHGLRIESCINSAFNQIKNRKGEMKNGTFIKKS